MTAAFSMGLPLMSRRTVTSMRAVGGGALYLRPRLEVPVLAPAASVAKDQNERGHEERRDENGAARHGHHCNAFDGYEDLGDEELPARADRTERRTTGEFRRA
jgi:hypothetical protein